MFSRMLLASLLCAASSALASGGHSLTVSAAVLSNSALYGPSPSALRMRHGSDATQFLPYKLSFPASGTYSDTVVLSLLP